jgi:6-phosphogluconolactonase (cycloisomerase 2 family)
MRITQINVTQHILRHLVWHPLHADVVFVANELDNSISLCHWDSSARLLAVTSSLPLLPLSCKEQVLASPAPALYSR